MHMRKQTLLSLLLVFILSSAIAQVRNVTGVVTDAQNKQPLEGVTVSVESNSKAVVLTNAKGEFTIAAKTGDI